MALKAIRGAHWPFHSSIEQFGPIQQDLQRIVKFGLEQAGVATDTDNIGGFLWPGIGSRTSEGDGRGLICF